MSWSHTEGLLQMTDIHARFYLIVLVHMQINVVNSGYPHA